MENLIHPGDHWVLMMSIASIGFLAVVKSRFVGTIGFFISTLYIGRNYNLWRALLHVILMLACILIMQQALQAFSYARNKKP
jgi:uncharacterized membrane protein